MYVDVLLPPPLSENHSGGPGQGAGEDSGQGAGALAAENEPERAGAAENEEPNVQPAGGLREPAGRQTGSGHGDQRLQEDAGGGGAEVWHTLDQRSGRLVLGLQKK